MSCAINKNQQDHWNELHLTWSEECQEEHFKAGGFYCCMNLLMDSCISSQLESRLNKYSFLSRFNLPGYSDGIIFQFLNRLKKYPDQKKYPNFYHWYILIKQFAPHTISKWIQDRLYYCAGDQVINSFIETYSQADDLKQAPLSARLILEGNQSFISKTCRKKADQNLYAIHILLKENSDKQFEQLRRCMSNYIVVISRSDRGDQAIISCKEESSKLQQLVNTISNSIQFLNLRIKKQKKINTQLL